MNNYYPNNTFVPQQNANMPEFKTRIYKGSNSIQMATNESGLLNTAQMPKTNDTLMVANAKQFLSYHMMRIVSESFNYLDYNVYTIINSYTSSLNLLSFIREDSGAQALKFNILAEIYKISELLLFYQKPLVKDIEIIKEEIGAMVDKLYKAV